MLRMLAFLQFYNSQALHHNYFVISMAEEDYGVFLNDKEYNELKKNKDRVVLLEKQIQQLIANDHSKNLKLGKVEKELEMHKEEVSFLIALLSSIGSPQDRSPEDIQQLEPSGNSASYEVLGESIMFPHKVDSKKSQLRSSDLLKKYSGMVHIIRSIEEKLESQEALIAKLNQMNSQKTDLILSQNTDKLLQVISDRANIKITSLDQLKESISQSKLLKQKVVVLEKQQVFLEKQQKEKKTENDRLKEQLKRLAAEHEVNLKRVTTENARIKGQIEKLVAEYKVNLETMQVALATFKGGDRLYRIKLLIDEYIQEMEKSLGKVGELSTQEIKSLLESELKSIIEYIPKSFNKKN